MAKAATGNKVFIDKNNFIHIRVVGKQSYDSVWAMGHHIAELAKQLQAHHRPVLIFDDLRQMSQQQPSEVRKAVFEVAKALPYEKVAMVGPNNTLLKYGTNFMIKAIGKGSKIHYFTNAIQAQDWLR